jgi:hypothetical protein
MVEKRGFKQLEQPLIIGMKEGTKLSQIESLLDFVVRKPLDQIEIKNILKTHQLGRFMRE